MHRITILKHLPWEWVARIKKGNRLCGALMANAPYIDSITASSKAQQSRNLAMGQLGAEMWTQVYRTGKSPTWNEHEHDGKYFSESQASWGLRAIAPEFSAKIITAMFRSGHIDSEPRQFTTNWSWFAGPQRLKVACFWGSICELRPVFQWKGYQPGAADIEVHTIFFHSMSPLFDGKFEDNLFAKFLGRSIPVAWCQWWNTPGEYQQTYHPKISRSMAENTTRFTNQNQASPDLKSQDVLLFHDHFHGLFLNWGSPKAGWWLGVPPFSIPHDYRYLMVIIPLNAVFIIVLP